MFESLEKIDWESVRHSRGPAGGIPKLLRSLLSTDKKTQSAAILELFDTIWNHGAVYEATAEAVPFLYEISEIPACFERFSVLWLLNAVANGSSHHQIHHPEKTSEVERELIWVKKAREAVRRGMATAIALLGAEDKELLLPVVLLLSSLGEDAALITPALSSALSKEKRPETRAGFGLALALLGDFHLEAFHLEDTKLPLPDIAALALACVGDKGLKEECHQMIEECLLATAAQQDQDWLFNEKKLLDATRLN